MTPEGKVKKKIRTILDKYKPRIYYHMPVPVGYGTSSVDFLGCFIGRFFVIEAKRAKKKPTSRQDGVLEDVRAAGGVTFVIAGDDGLEELELWLESVVDGDDLYRPE